MQNIQEDYERRWWSHFLVFRFPNWLFPGKIQKFCLTTLNISSLCHGRLLADSLKSQFASKGKIWENYFYHLFLSGALWGTSLCLIFLLGYWKTSHIDILWRKYFCWYKLYPFVGIIGIYYRWHNAVCMYCL